MKTIKEIQKDLYNVMITYNDAKRPAFVEDHIGELEELFHDLEVSYGKTMESREKFYKTLASHLAPQGFAQNKEIMRRLMFLFPPNTIIDIYQGCKQWRTIYLFYSIVSPTLYYLYTEWGSLKTQ